MFCDLKCETDCFSLLIIPAWLAASHSISALQSGAERRLKSSAVMPSIGATGCLDSRMKTGGEPLQSKKHTERKRQKKAAPKPWLCSKEKEIMNV